MKKVVLKFGGSSIADEKCISRSLDIISQTVKEEKQVFTVVSALGGVTNTLIELCDLARRGDSSYKGVLNDLISRHEQIVFALVDSGMRSQTLQQMSGIFHELRDTLNGLFLLHEETPRTRDLIMSSGERLSAILICSALRSKGNDCEVCDTRAVIVTNGEHGKAKVDIEASNKKIKAYFSDDKLYVCTGFIASGKNGETTTLGRSGSDYSASILASALDAEAIVIWTDVDGVMTADPRMTPDAFAIPEISYEDATELSHFGAKVIFPPTMIPAMQKNIPIRIRNTFDPDKPGTVISSSGTKAEFHATGIASIDNIALLRMQGSGMVGVRGISARLFDCLARNEINIILITQASSEHSICFAIDADQSGSGRGCSARELQA